MKKLRILCTLLAILLLLPSALLLTSCGDSKTTNQPDNENNQQGDENDPNTEGSENVLLTLNKEDLTLYIGDRFQLIPTATGMDNPRFLYSSTKREVAEVASDGTVIAMTEGDTTIICEIEGTSYRTFCTVTVKKDNSGTQGGNTNETSELLTLNTPSATLNVGDTHQLTATLVRPVGSDRTLTYTSSSPIVASVSENGLITALAAGTASITVKTLDGKLTAICIVAVNGNGGRNIILKTTDLTLEVEQSGKIEASYSTVFSSDPTELSFSSSLPSVATVDDKGNVTAVGVGTAIITISNFDGTAHANCTITVKEKPKASLTLDKETLSLEIDKTYTLIPNYIPAREGDSTALHFVSSLPTVATVDQSGKITAKSVGRTEISVTNSDGSATAVCVVTVTAKPKASLTLDKETLSLNEGDSFNLKATYTPAYSTDSRVLTYTTTNSAVATVDQNGKITAKASGIANITVTNKEGTVSATCQVTVKANSGKQASLSLDIYKLSLTVGESKTLHTSYTPASENDSGKLIFTSSSPSVLSVDAGGKITAKTAGTAVITVTNETGSVSKECTVTIKAAPTVPAEVVKKGSFKTNTGTKLNLLVEWTLSYDKYTKNYYLTADVYLESYSIVCGSRNNLSTIVIDGNEFKFNTAALDYSGVKEKQKIFFATATVIYEESELPETVGISALWVFNGSYSGVSIPVLNPSDTVTLK